MLPDLGLYWQLCVGGTNIVKVFIVTIFLKVEVRVPSGKIRLRLVFIVRKPMIILVLGVGLRFSISYFPSVIRPMF